MMICCDFDISSLHREDDEGDEETPRAKGALKKVTFDLSDESEGEDMEEILGGKHAEIPETKSGFEKRQEKVFSSSSLGY